MKKLLISLALIFIATSVYADAKTTYLICKGHFYELSQDKKKIYLDKKEANAQLTVQYRFDSDKKRLWFDTSGVMSLPHLFGGLDRYDDCLFSENNIICLAKIKRKYEMGKPLFQDKPASEMNKIMDRSYTDIGQSHLSINRKTGDMEFDYSQTIDITEPPELINVDRFSSSAKMICEKSNQNKF